MSIDERVRAGLHRLADGMAPDPERVLGAVTKAGRRRRRVRLVLMSTLGVVAGVGVLIGGVAAIDAVRDSGGKSRPGSTGQPATSWVGIWPQDSRAEAEEAQRAADAGDPAFTWQADAIGEEVVRRYAQEELGWEPLHLLDIEVESGAEEAGPRRWRVLRCAGDASNEIYPTVDCAPTQGRLSYEAEAITVERLIQRDESGIWIVTLAEPIAFDQVDPAPQSEVRDLMTEFLERRIAGSTAEPYVSQEALEEFGGDPGLKPLYSEGSEPPYEGFEITSIDGPFWPFGVYEVTVRIDQTGDASFTETFFVGPGRNVGGESRELVVTGGRPGAGGP